MGSCFSSDPLVFLFFLMSGREKGGTLAHAHSTSTFLATLIC